MSDRDAFIQSILANPADDTVRLIFADWLDENGVASDRIRANFIRRQVAGEVASVPLTLATELEPYLNGRPCHGYLANNGWPGYAELRYREAVFFYRRGFVDEVRLPLATFLEHAESLFRQHPITRVVLTNCRALAMDTGPSRRWLYESYDHTGLPGPFAELPACLFWRLGCLAAGGRKLGEWGWGYPTDDAADADLSTACVAYGRERAGLPPLETARVTA